MEKKQFRNIAEHVAYVNSMLENNDKLIIFDTETTGLDKDAKIIQFSAVLYKIGKDKELTEIENMDVYINPEEKLEPVITELTGITDEMLKFAGNEKVIAPSIMSFLYKAPLWSAYNIPFDLAKVESMCARCQIPYNEPDYFDTLTMAKNMIPKDNVKNHKLGTVTEYLVPGYEVQFHNSLEDVRATGVVLNVLAKMYEKSIPDKTVKEKLVVDWASYWKNPKRGDMRRVTIFSNRQNTGIFWDLSKMCWSHNANNQAAQLFSKVDIADIEEQVLSRYGKRYGATTMDDLAREMERAHNKKESDKRKALKEAEAVKSITEEKKDTAPIVEVESMESEEIDLW